MTRTEREKWITSIECCINHITTLNEDGYKKVAFILREHRAGCVEDLKPWEYSEVYNELDAIVANMR